VQCFNIRAEGIETYTTAASDHLMVKKRYINTSAYITLIHSYWKLFKEASFLIDPSHMSHSESQATNICPAIAPALYWLMHLA
jgi:hypothetical protein